MAAVVVGGGALGSAGPVGAEGSVALSEVGGSRAACGWSAPVDAPIVEEFQAPSDPFGPGGNRGIEFGTVPGQRVSAVAAGRVTFVGPVGGNRWLVITHEDGLRSTYGPLLATSVVRGQAVDSEEPIATADQGLHLTARTADRYLDPEPLLNGRCGNARLVAATGHADLPEGS